MIKLPQKITGFEQLNLGDKLGLGELWATYNCDFSKSLGTTYVSPRMILNINTDDDAQLSAPPCAFKAFTTTTPDIWAIAGSFMWKTSTGGPNDTFAQDATGSTPTNLSSDNSDMTVMSGSLVVTGSNDIYLLASAGTWSALANSLANTSGLHACTYFRATNKTYIVDDNAAGVTSLDDDLSTVVLSTSGNNYSLNDLVSGAGVNVGNEISCIASNTSRVGIGTINKSGSTCKFYTWDGVKGGGGTNGPNEEYTIDAGGVLAVIVVDDQFLIFDTKGRLMQLSGIGGTFKEIARLPLEGSPLKLPLTTATSRPVHYNGMSLVDGNIEILINTQLWDTNSTIKENCPSGVWCYDRKTGSFFHKRSVGHTKSGGTIVEYGQQKLSLVGALTEVEVISTDITQGSVNGKILVGCDYYTTATVTKSGIFYDDSNNTLQKAGHFVTQKIFSDSDGSKSISAIWQKIYLRFRRFLNSTDKFVIKYRTEEDEPSEATITYTSTTTFTVTLASTDNTLAVGDEVEFLQGVGAGRTAHITTISGAHAASQTITVDETITGATTQTAKARFQTWKKIGSYNSQDDDFIKFPITEGNTSVWIQFKIWILWTGKNEIHDLIISNQVNEAIE